MATTTIHIPDDLLHDIDRAAQSMGVSRNRFVLKACGAALELYAGEWPQGFFNSPETAGDRTILIEATRELEKDILARRMNRGLVVL